jgi:hypothetical protein
MTFLFRVTHTVAFVYKVTHTRVIVCKVTHTWSFYFQGYPQTCNCLQGCPQIVLFSFKVTHKMYIFFEGLPTRELNV